MKTVKITELKVKVNSANYCPLAGRKTTRWDRRTINDFEFILALSGNFYFTDHERKERITHRPGEVLAIHPREYHSYGTVSEAGNSFFSCIHVDLAENYQSIDFEPKIRRLTKLPPDSKIFNLFKDLNDEYELCGKYKIENIIMKEILLRLAELWGSPASGNQNILLRNMVDFLNAQLLSHPTRSTLAEKFKFSPQYINAVFKKELNISPVEYVHRQLARKGCDMLRYEGLSVKETAYALGFCSPFYFSKVFKKEFGFAPSSCLSRRTPAAISLNIS